jgi:hypothetical protein
VPSFAGTPNGRSSIVPAAESLLGRVHVQVSAELLARQAVQRIDKRVDVRDVVLGTPLHGRAHVAATARLELLEDDDQAVFEIVLTGKADSTTTGEAPPTRIHSRSTTHFTARKKLILDEQGLRALPATCSAEAHSTIESVSSSLPGLRGRISRRVAWRRAQDQRAAAERVSARHCEQTICRNFDADIAHEVRVANSWLAEHLKSSLAARDRSKVLPQFKTSPDHLRVTGLTADLAELAAVGQTLESSDIAVRLVLEGDHLVFALGVR